MSPIQFPEHTMMPKKTHRYGAGRRLWIIGLWSAAAAFAACGENPEEARRRATEILTARTVGLAYLEENKLPEAEAEFLKLIDLVPDEPLGYADLGLVYLRMGRYEDAEVQVKRALEFVPDDPNIRLILAKVYELTDREEDAISELERTLTSAPGHLKSRYTLAELLNRPGDPAAMRRAAEELQAVVAQMPANTVARLQLVETLVRTGQADLALAQLEDLRQLIPEIPTEANPFLDGALTQLRAGDTDAALRPVITFHNFLKATSIYQGDVIDLKGPGGALIGFPVITFHQDLSLQAPDEQAVLAALRFADVTSEVGLDAVGSGEAPAASATRSHAVAADYDGDGDHDAYLITGSAAYLLQNDLGVFTDVTGSSGIRVTGTEAAATFADFDNDGLLDLYVVRNGPNALFKNAGDGRFEDVTASAAVADPGAGAASAFLDIDHDGDLDAYVANDGENRLYRNNADGTFTETAGLMGLAGPAARSRDVAFGDFDDDGDIDLFVVNDGASNVLYSNLRQSRFENATEQAGLTSDGTSSSVAVGDYDNDGFLDLFISSTQGGHHVFYRNRNDGTFEVDRRPRAVLDALSQLGVREAAFFDFDNDGFLDLLVVMASSTPTPRGMLLFRNIGPGRFADFSNVLPAEATALSIAATDFGNDGDMDILLTQAKGARLLRNDGGNVNHYLTMKLVGLTAGSGKNNYYGIGAKLEVRAGNLYQLRVVTEPTTHIGLGGRLKADVVRIVWTNGVPQNIFFPGGDQDLLEQQILKGSCAFLYTWNGSDYTFVKDVMWKSALGMPTGIMGGSQSYGPPQASREYLKIPGDQLQPRNGKYSLQLTEELWEVAYVDEVQLVTIDHPDSVDVYVDEKFVPPGPVSLRLYPVTKRHPPAGAWDEHGTDVLARILEPDDVFVDNLRPGRYQGVTALHDLVLDIDSAYSNDSLLLFLRGWLFPTDASINVAMAQSSNVHSVAPYLQVQGKDGRWHTVVEDMGFPSGKDKTVVVDLTGKLAAGARRIRIRTNMEIYWDHVFFAARHSAAELRQTRLSPAAADLHFRGYSRLYRKGGRHGPHWFDYADVSEESPWLPMTGTYTRFGDVLPLLLASDNRYAIMAAGDEITVEFEAAGAPPLPAGWTRDFLIYTDGWIKDGDLNTATGQTVEPLPFHQMTQYPYGQHEAFPDDDGFRQYQRDYNTRVVTSRKN